MKTIYVLLATLVFAITLVAQDYNMSTTTVTTCSGTFYDSEGGAGSYSNGQDLEMTFTSDNGNRISFDFQAFYTENGNDYLYIYDGPTSDYPLIGYYTGSTTMVPDIVTSTGTSLTFIFHSDGSIIYSGWEANISCTTAPLSTYILSAGTINACEGVFYDAGGADANYFDNEDITETFCSDAGNFVVFDFTTYNYDIDNSDTLFVYDGSSISDPLIGKYTGNQLPEIISSKMGSCLTFRFISDGAINEKGWQALVSCQAAPVTPEFTMSDGVRYTCGGTFYDSGGSSGSYFNNQDRTMTFVSDNGNRLSFDFQAFYTENGNDYLYIYDGPTTEYPLIGYYTGSTTMIPDIVTSTGTSLTFTFHSDGSIIYSGWEANISCAGAPLQAYNMSSGIVNACEGVFYDSGNGGTNYSDDEDGIVTFCSDSGSFITMNFTNSNFDVEPGDSLFVYDGDDILANPIAILTGHFSPIQISSITGSCLTFRFVSNATTTSDGWQGLISCSETPPSSAIFTMAGNVWYTCNALFYDSGGATGNYINNENKDMTFCSNSGCPISVDFTSLATEGSFDVLSIYDGINTSSALLGSYSGTTNPGVLVSTGSCLTFNFNSDGSTNNAGWAALLSCDKASITVIPDTVACVNDTITLTANSGVSYNWNTGETTQSIYATNTGIYSVIVEDALACNLVSDPTTLNFNPNPTIPVISESGDTLYASVSGLHYEWYLDETLVYTSSSASYYAPPVSGTYYVIVTDDNTCSSFSDEYVFILTSIKEKDSNHISVYPNPSNGIFTIEGDGIIGIEITNISGQIVKQIEITSEIMHSVNMRNQPKGIYFVKIQTPNNIKVEKIIIN